MKINNELYKQYKDKNQIHPKFLKNIDNTIKSWEQVKSKIEEKDTNTIRICISTDQHIGCLEDDPIRGEDPYRAQEETLQIAYTTKCDFILMCGDLFHRNKPSQKSIYRVIDMLRQYCFGNRNNTTNNIIVNREENTVPNDERYININDKTIQIQQPIFAIHGNHDEPSGIPASSVLDILYSCSLINYFGKNHIYDNVLTIYPQYFTNNNTYIAIYGQGYMRDEKLLTILKNGYVNFIKPKDINYFTILLQHQNRTKHSNDSNNYIDESLLPSWQNLIIWGHEHHCIIEDIQTKYKHTIIQPGSSVITSLSDSETREKHIAILDIYKKKYKRINIPQRTQRIFLMKDISLNYIFITELSKNYTIDNITNKFIEIVQECIDTAINILKNKGYDDNDYILPQCDLYYQKEYHLQQTSIEYDDKILLINDEQIKKQEKILQDQYSIRKKPQIRIRVNSENFPRINTLRFGSLFTGKIANPNDIQKYTRNKRIKKILQNSTMQENISIYNTNNNMEISSYIPTTDSTIIPKLMSNYLLDKPLQVQNLDNIIYNFYGLQCIPITNILDVIHKYVINNEEKALSQYICNIKKDIEEKISKMIIIKSKDADDTNYNTSISDDTIYALIRSYTNDCEMQLSKELGKQNCMHKDSELYDMQQFDNEKVDISVNKIEIDTISSHQEGYKKKDILYGSKRRKTNTVSVTSIYDEQKDVIESLL